MKALIFRVLFALMLLMPFAVNGASEVSRGFVLSTAIWDTSDIPVCWESYATSSEKHRRQVQFAVKYTWETESKVRFHGWKLCNATSSGIRIAVADTGPHVKALGSRLDGRVNGMVLNFTYRNWSQICQLMVDFCNEAIAVHEFGHALGFAHEHNRPDTPDTCTVARQGTDGDTIIGDWDLESVMNYCNPRYNNDGELSDGDKFALALLYGVPDHFKLGRWATDQGGYPATAKWLAGDFDGDGNDDIAKVFSDSGKASIGIHQSNGAGGFNLRRRATRLGTFNVGQQWLAGDVDGDGRDDIIKVFFDQGQISIDVYRSEGSGYYYSRWLTRHGKFSAADRWRVGDFNGDGRDDLASVFAENGKASVDVYAAATESFSPARWISRQGGIWASQSWMAGDFNGDGKDDLARAFQHGANSISVDLMIAGSESFSASRWLTKSGQHNNNTQWMSGEFTGDGQYDITAVYRSTQGTTSGNLYQSDGQGFDLEPDALRSQGGYRSDFNWLVGDFNGDGRDDIAKAFRSAGKVSIGVHRSR